MIEERELNRVKNRKKYKLIDLFCGCGGFSKGFQQAGFDIVGGIDSWNDATLTFSKNFSESIVLNEDITHMTGNYISDKFGVKASNIDVIIGGPPCQGFSLSGKRLLEDPRNDLYKSFVRLVKELGPKIFVMENVPGLIGLFDGKVRDKVINDFSVLGYNVNFQILSSERYGVPQIRKRVFFVGLKKNHFGKDIFFNFPQTTHGENKLTPITAKEAISDLDFIPDDQDLGDVFEYSKEPESNYQKMIRDGSKLLYNHSTVLHKERTKNIISMVPDGGNYKSLPKELWTTRKVNIAWTRMNSNKPCFTIDTGHNHHFHYKENRVPTVRESARIQSFPDTFVFFGKKTSQLKQVGNAVPPLLSQALAFSILETLEDK